jgi:hypothetical protein
MIYFELAMLALVSIGVLARCQRIEGTLSAKKVGGITHWRAGKIGGSFYLAKVAK